MVTAPRAITPPPTPPEAPPKLSREEARARAEKLRTSWRDVQYSEAAARAAWLTERHPRAAEAYLRTLGFPDPLRLAEEVGVRWGGAAASFTMRDHAASIRVPEKCGYRRWTETVYHGERVILFDRAPGGGAEGA